MQLRITIAMYMVEIRNKKTLQSKVNIYAKVTSKSATMPTAYPREGHPTAYTKPP